MPQDTNSQPIYAEEPAILGRLGNLETRLIRSQDELAEAQKLRYQVFYEEMGAVRSASIEQQKSDFDAFDAHCDHLLVLDNDQVVGTYRLLTQQAAQSAGGFYSQSEFDLDRILTNNPKLNFLELGRSCIAPTYRTKRTMELLWHGTWAYALRQKTDVMFGCASFPGTDPSTFAGTLGWLAENAALPPREACAATQDSKVDLLEFSGAPKNLKKALAGLPPMLKGYLRLGAKVSTEAAIDHAFGTTDVLVVLKVADINPRYIAHFGADASRYAA